MSENLSPYQELKFKSAVAIGGQSPVSKRSFCTKEKVILTFDIKYSFFREIQKSKCVYPELTFVCILNSQIKPLCIKQCERVEERLCRLTNNISALHKKQKGGRQQEIFNKKEKKLAIYESEVENADRLSTVLTSFQKDNVELENRCRLLLIQLKESQKLQKESEQKADILSRKVLELKKENESLQVCLGVPDDECLENKGKCMENVSKSQRYRQIKVLQSKIDKALWFADSYGLRPTSIKLGSSDGESIHIPLGMEDSSVDMEKMKEILFILDKFKISDEAYHEIVRKADDLPKLHSIIRLREQTNSAFEIHRTPGNIPGAYVSLRSELINILKIKEDTTEKIKIKISGDEQKLPEFLIL